MPITTQLSENLPQNDSSSDSSATLFPEINFTSHFSERILRNWIFYQRGNFENPLIFLREKRIKIWMWKFLKNFEMGRGPGIPLEIKQAIAQIFDEFGNTKKARREARNFHSKARPGFNQLSQ